MPLDYSYLSDKDQLDSRLSAARSSFPGRRLYVADTAAGFIIFGKPKSADYELYRTELLSDEKEIASASRKTLFRACMVDPPVSNAAELLDEWMGLPDAKPVSEALAKCIGTLKEDNAKK